MSTSLYLITNKNTGHRYAGISEEPKYRWHDHKAAAEDGAKTPLHVAIREQGIDTFEFEVLHTYSRRYDAGEAEKDLIAHLQLQNEERGYNVQNGGDVEKWSHETNNSRMKEIEANIQRVAKAKGLDPDVMRARILADAWDFAEGHVHAPKPLKQHLGVGAIRRCDSRRFGRMRLRKWKTQTPKI